MVAVRAVETGKAMARPANTGITAFIDPAGRVLARTELGLVEGTEDVDVDRAVVGRRLAPNHVEQLVARERLVRMAREKEQQLELARPQFDLLTVHEYLAGDGVDDEAAEVDHAAIALSAMVRSHAAA